MPRLAFRHLDVSPADPVEDWGVDGILAALDRGDLRDWRRIAEAARREPWGAAALDLEQALPLARDRGAAGLLGDALDLARRQRLEAERREVAEELAGLVVASGLTRAEFAARLGTSRTRLSSYLHARVTPAATVLVRARAVASAARH